MLLVRSVRSFAPRAMILSNRAIVGTTRWPSSSPFIAQLNPNFVRPSIGVRLRSTQETVYGGESEALWEEEATDLEDGDADTNRSFEDEDDEDFENNDDEEDDATDMLLEEHDSWTKSIEKATQSMEKKQRALQSELEKAETVEQTVERAQLIVSNLYLFQNNPRASTVTVYDWENDGAEMELTLNPKYGSANEEAEALFERARKLRRGSVVVKNLLVETRNAFQILLDAKMDLESSRQGDEVVDVGRLRLVQDRLERTSKQTNFQHTETQQQNQRSPQRRKRYQSKARSIMETGVRKLHSPGGCIVLVGRNRRGNEYLSLNAARGNDVWMHARGCPGAHVILQNRRGSPKPTEECLQFCANLAVFYSDARTERRASVTAAEPKHIQKPRGAPLGAVKVREELYTLVGMPADVPDELKAAREESGLTDEFRATDKAKHRKRTKAVAKQQQRERRAQAQAKSKRKRKGDGVSSDLPDMY